MSVRKKLISNTVYIFLSWFSMTFFGLLFWLVIGKILIPEYYGIIATAIQVELFVFPIVSLGLFESTKRLIPELRERKEKGKIQGVINFSLGAIIISSLITSSILMVLSPNLTSFLELSFPILCLVSILMIVDSLGNFFGAIHYGFQNMKRLFSSNFFGHLVRFLLTLILLLLGFSYYGPLIAYITCYSIILVILFDKKFFKVARTVTTDRGLILKYSFPALITIIFVGIMRKTQYILLTFFKTIEETGFFAVANNISSIVPIVPSILSSALLPITSALSASKKKEVRQSYLIKLVFRYGLFFVLPIAVFLIIFSKHLIVFFSSTDYLEAEGLLPFLSLAGVFSSLGLVFQSSLVAIGEPKKSRNVWIISSLSYLGLAIILTYYFSGTGLALAYLISTITFFFSGLLFLRKHLTINFPLKDALRIFLALFISFLFLLICRPLINNLFIAGIFVIIASIIYLLVLLKVNFYIEEDLKVLDFFGDRLPVLGKQIKSLNKFLSTHIKRSYQEV